MARHRSPPAPPADLAARDLPIELLAPGTTLLRIHRRGLGTLHFGSTGASRFDDPRRGFGVCYVARTLEGAFAETCLRAVGAPFVARAYLAERVATAILVKSDLRLIALHGAGLARVGATGVVSAGDHRIAQRWSAAFHVHPAMVDGIAYRANHDNGEICAALFDRCRRRLIEGDGLGLLDDGIRLARLLERYQVGLG